MATAALDCPTIASTLNLIVPVASLDQKQGHLTFTEELEIVLNIGVLHKSFEKERL